MCGLESQHAAWFPCIDYWCIGVCAGFVAWILVSWYLKSDLSNGLGALLEVDWNDEATTATHKVLFMANFVNAVGIPLLRVCSLSCACPASTLQYLGHPPVSSLVPSITVSASLRRSVSVSKSTGAARTLQPVHCSPHTAACTLQPIRSVWREVRLESGLGKLKGKSEGWE